MLLEFYWHVFCSSSNTIKTVKNTCYRSGTFFYKKQYCRLLLKWLCFHHCLLVCLSFKLLTKWWIFMQVLGLEMIKLLDLCGDLELEHITRENIKSVCIVAHCVSHFKTLCLFCLGLLNKSTSHSVVWFHWKYKCQMTEFYSNLVGTGNLALNQCLLAVYMYMSHFCLSIITN